MIIDESQREASRIYFSVQLKFVIALMGACFSNRIFHLDCS